MQSLAASTLIASQPDMEADEITRLGKVLEMVMDRLNTKDQESVTRAGFKYVTGLKT